MHPELVQEVGARTGFPQAGELVITELPSMGSQALLDAQCRLLRNC